MCRGSKLTNSQGRTQLTAYFNLLGRVISARSRARAYSCSVRERLSYKRGNAYATMSEVIMGNGDGLLVTVILQLLD